MALDEMRHDLRHVSNVTPDARRKRSPASALRPCTTFPKPFVGKARFKGKYFLCWFPSPPPDVVYFKKKSGQEVAPSARRLEYSVEY